MTRPNIYRCSLALCLKILVIYSHSNMKLAKQVYFGTFCDILIFPHFSQKQAKSFNLASYDLQFLKIGLMDFQFLKGCGSGRLWDTF